MNLRLLFIATGLAPLLTLGGHADVRLPVIFGDHMVLQQGVPLPVWGTADAGEKVTVSIAGKQATATTDKNGRWMLKLDSLPATGTPVQMEVAGKNKLTISDVLVGEVWVCSGQSNMVLGQRNIVSAEVGNRRRIRFFKTPLNSSMQPQDDTKGSWMVCTPENAAALFPSATGYYFAVDLEKARNAPVGMIQSAWSGTAIEPWIDITAFERSDSYRKTAEKLRNTNPAPAQPEAPPATEAGAEGDRKPQNKEAGRFSRTPTGIFNAMINPHVPYAIKGVLWYQGEANAQTEKRSEEYATLLPLLISSWRNAWRQGDFPFLYVQLPAFTTDRAWPRLRNSQLKTLAVPNTGMAVALDLNPTDNLHPPHKEAVGQRLALLARKIAYGEKIVASGPLYKAHRIEGGKVRIAFTETGGGLTAGEPPPLYRRATATAGRNGKLLGFEISGENGAFAPANAEIDGDTVVVWSETVARPVHVAYAWAAYPGANLYNKEGLPASPFRTDDLPKYSKPQALGSLQDP